MANQFEESLDWIDALYENPLTKRGQAWEQAIDSIEKQGFIAFDALHDLMVTGSRPASPSDAAFAKQSPNLLNPPAISQTKTENCPIPHIFSGVGKDFTPEENRATLIIQRPKKPSAE